VYRAVFRQCYERWKYIQAHQDCARGRAGMARTVFADRGDRRGYSWGRRNEEFCADFELLARRSLSDLDHRIFRLHFLLGADWRLCCGRISVDRGKFFHAVYRIERKLGKAYAELAPYALFPLDEYFGTWRRRTVPVVIERPRPWKPLRAFAASSCLARVL
jgi:hypothetical protein